MLNGSYETNVGAPRPSQQFPLIGKVSGDLVSFIVDFAEYGSLTAWVGQVVNEPDQPIIRTVWHLS